ncbi:MAG: hypothetical protein ACYTDY_02330 [Planctomycetota bacterium]
MTELRAFAAVLFLLEAFHHSGLVAPRRPSPVDLLWFLLLGTAAGAGHLAFRGSPAFLECLIGLVVIHLVRVRAGLLSESSRLLARWRYVPAAAVFAFTGSAGAAFAALLLLAASRKNARALLLAAGRFGWPVTISPLDVDQIVPPKLRYDRSDRESGITLVEAIVGMTLLATISAALFTAAAGRASRLRQVKETATVREATVSALERLAAVPFEELAEHDGEKFEVPAGTGTTRITFTDEGLARIEVEAPRRGAAPVRLETLRTRRTP